MNSRKQVYEIVNKYLLILGPKFISTDDVIIFLNCLFFLEMIKFL